MTKKVDGEWFSRCEFSLQAGHLGRRATVVREAEDMAQSIADCMMDYALGQKATALELCMGVLLALKRIDEETFVSERLKGMPPLPGDDGESSS